VILQFLDNNLKEPTYKSTITGLIIALTIAYFFPSSTPDFAYFIIGFLVALGTNQTFGGKTVTEKRQ
jgi:energy-converting hydrogenase Eha subunit B